MHKAIHQRDEFRAELFLQLIYLLSQRLDLFSIFLLNGPLKLPREIENLAIGLGLRLVIGDGANDVSCVRL
jgi:hypothetical protein